MRSKLFQITLLIVLSMVIVPAPLFASENPVAGAQGSGSDDQKYAGVWIGSYSVDNGYTNKLALTFSKDDKGQWRGAMKYTNEGGEQTIEFKSLQIADGKMKGKFESPDGQVEGTVEGRLQGERLEGVYSGYRKGTTEIMEKGTWTATKNTAAKPGP
jgi:hypothetical protein